MLEMETPPAGIFQKEQDQDHRKADMLRAVLTLLFLEILPPEAPSFTDNTTAQNQPAAAAGEGGLDGPRDRRWFRSLRCQSRHPLQRLAVLLGLQRSNPRFQHLG